MSEHDFNIFLLSKTNIKLLNKFEFELEKLHSFGLSLKYVLRSICQAAFLKSMSVLCSALFFSVSICQFGSFLSYYV